MAEEARFTRTLHLVLRGLVLSVLLAVPVALLLPGLQSSRVPVQRAQCTYNLRQIALAFRNYASAHGDLPSEAINSRDGKRLLSWRVAILLCLEEGPFYQKFKLDEPWDSPHNKAIFRSTLPSQGYSKSPLQPKHVCHEQCSLRFVRHSPWFFPAS